MAATKNARDIFLDALDRAPADRAAYLDAACDDDTALRQRVEAVLRANDEPGAFLSEAKPGVAVNATGTFGSADGSVAAEPTASCCVAASQPAVVPTNAKLGVAATGAAAQPRHHSQVHHLGHPHPAAVRPRRRHRHRRPVRRTEHHRRTRQRRAG